MGAYWLGFVIGGFAIMSLFAAARIGSPAWLFVALLLWLAVAASAVACRRRKKAEEKDIVLSRLRKELV